MHQKLTVPWQWLITENCPWSISKYSFGEKWSAIYYRNVNMKFDLFDRFFFNKVYFNMLHSLCLVFSFFKWIDCLWVEGPSLAFVETGLELYFNVIFRSFLHSMLRMMNCLTLSLFAITIIFSMHVMLVETACWLMKISDISMCVFVPNKPL